MRTSHPVVVAGAGAAGHSAASTLRREGYTGPLTVVHGERLPPYNRTLVNKAVLQGLLSAEQIALPSLDSLDVEVVHAQVTGVDVEAGELVLADGHRLRYTALIGATGSEPRSATLDAGRSARSLQVHTVGDASRIRDLLGEDSASATVTLLGAGFIGAETASYLADLGASVHLVSRPALPLAAALGDAIAQRLAAFHRDHVHTHFGRSVLGVRADHDSACVTLEDGTRLESDFVVVAYGTVPASRWANHEHSGIVVDDRLRALHLPAVYAAGSVALHTAGTGHRYLVDHWDAAVAQGAHAARSFLHDTAGAPDPGRYAPTTGFTLNVYRQPIAVYGVPLPGDLARQHADVGSGILTTFHSTQTGSLTAVAGLAAGGELGRFRSALQRP